jgi:hypothetical protein
MAEEVEVQGIQSWTAGGDEPNQLREVGCFVWGHSRGSRDVRVINMEGCQIGHVEVVSCKISEVASLYCQRQLGEGREAALWEERGEGLIGCFVLVVGGAECG